MHLYRILLSSPSSRGTLARKGTWPLIICSEGVRGACAPHPPPEHRGAGSKSPLSPHGQPSGSQERTLAFGPEHHCLSSWVPARTGGQDPQISRCGLHAWGLQAMEGLTAWDRPPEVLAVGTLPLQGARTRPRSRLSQEGAAGSPLAPQMWRGRGCLSARRRALGEPRWARASRGRQDLCLRP